MVGLSGASKVEYLAAATVVRMVVYLAGATADLRGHPMVASMAVR